MHVITAEPGVLFDRVNSAVAACDRVLLPVRTRGKVLAIE